MILSKQISALELVRALPFFLIPLGLQLFAWKAVYGDFLVFSYGHEGEYFNWSRPAIWQVLFSPNHGLFYWHPLFLVGLGGFVVFALREQSKYLLFLLSIILTAYVNAAWHVWWLGSSFGQRNFECTLLAMAIGMCYLLGRVNNDRFLHIACIGMSLLMFWNINLCILYSAGAISRNAPVTFWEMVHASMGLYGRLLLS
jgi:hypothetical protein